MSRDATWVVNTCAKFEMYMTYRSRVMTINFSIDRHLKLPIFTFLRVKGSNFKFHLSNPAKGTSLAGTTNSDALNVGVRPKGVTKKRKIGEKLSCVKLAICPDHPRRHSTGNFACGVVSGRIYLKFYENW